MGIKAEKKDRKEGSVFGMKSAPSCEQNPVRIAGSRRGCFHSLRGRSGMTAPSMMGWKGQARESIFSAQTMRLAWRMSSMEWPCFLPGRWCRKEENWAFVRGWEAERTERAVGEPDSRMALRKERGDDGLSMW